MATAPQAIDAVRRYMLDRVTRIEADHFQVRSEQQHDIVLLCDAIDAMQTIHDLAEQVRIDNAELYYEHIYEGTAAGIIHGILLHHGHARLNTEQRFMLLHYYSKTESGAAADAGQRPKRGNSEFLSRRIGIMQSQLSHAMDLDVLMCEAREVAIKPWRVVLAQLTMLQPAR